MRRQKQVGRQREGKAVPWVHMYKPLLHALCPCSWRGPVQLMTMDVNPREVPCGVPRALSLILSDLSLDENSGGILIKGVDVTNLGGRVNTRGDRMRTWSDPDRLECWVKNNKIQFNRPKCKVWHLRAKNKWQKHRVGEIALAGSHVKNI